MNGPSVSGVTALLSVQWSLLDLIPLVLKQSDFVPRAQVATSGDICVAETRRQAPPSAHGWRPELMPLNIFLKIY